MTIEGIKESVCQALVEASTRFRPDQLAAYQESLDREESPQGRWVLRQIIENAHAAWNKRYPLCDDTGIPHVFIEVGRQFALTGADLEAIAEGVADGLRTLPGRPMAVRGEGLALLGQTEGLYDDPAMLIPAPFSIRAVASDGIRVTVLMLGGGPEIRGKTMRVFHRHDGENVMREVADWAAEAAAALGCTPCVPLIGIGRTQYEAASLMLEAAREGDFGRQSPLEQFVTDRVNATGVGPLGLGRTVTALGCFLRIGPQRASGIRVVSLRLGCCFDPRRATVEL